MRSFTHFTQQCIAKFGEIHHPIGIQSPSRIFISFSDMMFFVWYFIDPSIDPRLSWLGPSYIDFLLPGEDPSRKIIVFFVILDLKTKPFKTGAAPKESKRSMSIWKQQNTRYISIYPPLVVNHWESAQSYHDIPPVGQKKHQKRPWNT